MHSVRWASRSASLSPRETVRSPRLKSGAGSTAVGEVADCGKRRDTRFANAVQANGWERTS